MIDKTAKVFLSLTQQVHLFQYIQEKYTASKANDHVFAIQASKELGFRVSTKHVQRYRAEQKIPANHAPTTNASAAVVEEFQGHLITAQRTIDQLTARVEALTEANRNLWAAHGAFFSEMKKRYPQLALIDHAANHKTPPSLKGVA